MPSIPTLLASVCLSGGVFAGLFGLAKGFARLQLETAMACSRIENGGKVLFTRTTDLVQKLQIARRDLTLEAALAQLDRFDQLILDDLAHITKNRAETSVVFELIGARYERRSILITAPTAEPASGASQMRQRPNSREHFR